MFTGVIREIATVLHFDGKKMRLGARHRPERGDSIAVNGVCLSVTELHSDGFTVEVGDETRKVVAVENFKGRVHIEPAMRLSDRIEGHIVQGHIDAVGTIRAIERGENATQFSIEVSERVIPLIAPKGSIAVDGVSLTINDVFQTLFRLTLIPITMEETLFSTYREGRRVNIETDLFARYTYHILQRRGQPPQAPLTWEEIDRFHSLF
ncbi:MAG: riboflavin synthase [Epsilonproteobacteria bacterium]|nr:riboflavin synthase [Campylobacterota bacterium]NPA56766.1 riboflavin synthase [Campylobacterota bacterium]